MIGKTHRAPRFGSAVAAALLALGHAAVAGGQPATGLRVILPPAGMVHWDGPRAEVRSAAFSPDGRTLATASARTVVLWSAETGSEVRTLRIDRGWIAGVRWAGNGSIVIAGEVVAEGDRREGFVRVLSAETGEELRSIALPLATSCLDVSADGKLAAVGFAARSGAAPGDAPEKPTVARVVSLETGEAGASFSGRWPGALSVALSPDGSKVACVLDGDGTVRVGSARDGKLTREVAEPYAVGAAWSPDGKLLAVASLEGHAAIVPAEGGAEARRIEWRIEGEGPAAVPAAAVAWSGDGTTIALSSAASAREVPAAALFDAATGRRLERAFPAKAPEDTAHDVAFSADGKRIAVGSNTGRVALLDAGSGAQIRPTAALDLSRAGCAALSPDGRTLASGRGKDVVLRRVDDGAEVRRLEMSSAVTALAFRPDGAALAAVMKQGGKGGSAVEVRGIATGGVLASFSAAEAIACLAWKPDGSALATGHRDLSPEADSAVGLSVKVRSPAGEDRLAFAGHAAGTFLPKLVLGAGHALVSSAAWSPDGKTVASAAGNIIRLWSAEDAREIRALLHHERRITGMAWSPDGSLIASSDTAGHVVLWDPSSGTAVHGWSLPGAATVLGIAPEGRAVVLWTASGALAALNVPDRAARAAPVHPPGFDPKDPTAALLRAGPVEASVVAARGPLRQPVRITKDAGGAYLVACLNTFVLSIRGAGDIDVILARDDGIGLSSPLAALDDRLSDDVFVADQRSGILRLSPAGNVRPMLARGDLKSIEDVVQERSSGDLIVTDVIDGSLHRVTLKGRLTTIARAPALAGVRGVAEDLRAGGFVAAAGKNLFRVGLDGRPLPLIGSHLKNPLRLPNGVVQDPMTGSFVLVDEVRGALVQVDLRGRAEQLSSLPFRGVGLCLDPDHGEITLVLRIDNQLRGALVRFGGLLSSSPMELASWRGREEPASADP